MKDRSLAAQRTFVGARITFLTFIGAFLLSLAWAISLPLGAGPDEPAHIVKAASVVRGEFLGHETERAGITEVTVPASLEDSLEWSCYRFDQSKTGGCQGELPARQGTGSTTTSAGLYNPIYYLLVGWPSLLTDSPTVMVWGMRALTALGSVLLAATAFAVSTRVTSRLVSLGVGAAIITPMTLFLSSIVNPNAWEVYGGIAFISGLLWFSVTQSINARSAILPAIAIGAGGFLAASARGASPFWLLLLGLLFLIATPPSRIRSLLRNAQFLTGLGIAIIGAGIGALWTLTSGTLSAMGEYPGKDLSPAAAFVRMILLAPSDIGLFGNFGWLDTPTPMFVHAIYGFTTLSLVVIALAVSDTRWRSVVIASILFYFVAPATMQALSVKNSGWIWQGRYSMILFVSILVVSSFAILVALRRKKTGINSSSLPLQRGITLVLVLTFLAQFWSFLLNLQRYSVANSGDIRATLLEPVWSPVLFGTHGAIMVYLVGMALIALATFLAWREQRSASALTLLVRN